MAVLFGAVTMVAAFRVLTGTSPGYVVFLPLLIYNATMGVAYVAVGASAWRNIGNGRTGSLVIFLLNLGVLAAISLLHLAGDSVAIESVRAMSFRAGAWLLLFLGFRYLSHWQSDPDYRIG